MQHDFLVAQFLGKVQQRKGGRAQQGGQEFVGICFRRFDAAGFPKIYYPFKGVPSASGATRSRVITKPPWVSSAGTSRSMRSSARQRTPLTTHPPSRRRRISSRNVQGGPSSHAKGKQAVGFPVQPQIATPGARHERHNHATQVGRH